MKLLTDRERTDFDARLDAARALLDDADPGNDSKARREVRRIKNARRALKAGRRETRAAERRAEGGGFWAQIAGAVINEEKGKAVVMREVMDLRGALIAGTLSDVDALAIVRRGFIVEADDIIDGEAIVPVLIRFGVPSVLAAAMGFGLEAIDGPLLASCWSTVEAEARRQIAKHRAAA